MKLVPQRLCSLELRITLCKGSALLDTVDAFVLRPMILVQPADILHGADAPYIQQKQSNTDHTLNNRHQGAVADKAVKQRGNEIRQYDKDAYCQHNGDHRHNTRPLPPLILSIALSNFVSLPSSSS